jgi:hypothetical protein
VLQVLALGRPLLLLLVLVVLMLAAAAAAASPLPPVLLLAGRMTRILFLGGWCAHGGEFKRVRRPVDVMRCASWPSEAGGWAGLFSKGVLPGGQREGREVVEEGGVEEEEEEEARAGGSADRGPKGRSGTDQTVRI